MKNIVLVMKRASLAQGLMTRMASREDVRLYYEPDYTGACAAVRDHHAQVALLEVTEGGCCGADYCLGLCAWMRETVPACRLLLMCPERDPAAVQKMIGAKRNGLIDDFVFYETSLEYLETNLRSL